MQLPVPVFAASHRARHLGDCGFQLMEIALLLARSTAGIVRGRCKASTAHEIEAYDLVPGDPVESPLWTQAQTTRIAGFGRAVRR